MSDPDPPTDPDGAGTDSGGTGPDGDDAGTHESTPGRRTKPRLANAPREDGTETGDDADEGPTDALGALRDPEPIEPETPRAENVLFVLLGVLGTVALLATVIVPGVL